ncbi:MAG: BofC C-terminal domain-containing protein [Firmicutes bacterium]|nr:BofC C-terminal domain-containing protein [Bacillota bacterium]
MLKPKERWIVVALALAVFIGSFTYAYWSLREASRPPDRTRPKQAALPGRGTAMALPQAIKEGLPTNDLARTAVSTRIVTRIQHTFCGNEEIIEAVAGRQMANLNRAEFARLYPGATVEEFNPRRVTVRIRRDDFCDKHASARYLGIERGYVAIFQGLPGMKRVLVETTQIEARFLPDREVADLEKGIPVKNEQEMLDVLQGLAGLSEGW